MNLIATPLVGSWSGYPVFIHFHWCTVNPLACISFQLFHLPRFMKINVFFIYNIGQIYSLKTQGNLKCLEIECFLPCAVARCMCLVDSSQNLFIQFYISLNLKISLNEHILCRPNRIVSNCNVKKTTLGSGTLLPSKFAFYCL